MADAKEPPEDSATSKAEAMALLEEAEAEAAEAEALAAAARARARAARLRREAMASAEADAETKAEGAVAEGHGDAPADEAADEAADKEAPAADAQAEEVEETAEHLDESDAEASDEAAEAAEPESRPARWRRRLPALSVMWKIAAIILIICFAVASGYMAWQHREATDREQRAARFVAGARQGVVNMTSLNFTKAKEDVQRVIDSSTGEFRDDFQRSAKDFTTVVEKSKVVTEGTVNAAALESLDEHSASVLVSATSKITNAAGAKDEPRAWRLRVVVTEDGGQYKMSKVDFVP
jgi:Mce-associated membrane protein